MKGFIMGMGYIAVHTSTIEEDTLSGVCKVEFDAFINFTDSCGFDIDNQFHLEMLKYVNGYEDGEEVTEEDFKTTLSLYNELTKKFNDETNLTLELCCHNSDDDGSCYDDVNGHFWAVDDVYVLSDAAKAFNDKHGSGVIIETSYVQYG